MSAASAFESFGLLIQIFSGALGSAAPGSSPSASINERLASCCSGVHWSWGISAKRPTVGCACDASVFPVCCHLSCSGNVVVCFIGLSSRVFDESRHTFSSNRGADLKLLEVGSLMCYPGRAFSRRLRNLGTVLWDSLGVFNCDLPRHLSL